MAAFEPGWNENPKPKSGDDEKHQATRTVEIHSSTVGVILCVSRYLNRCVSFEFFRNFSTDIDELEHDFVSNDSRHLQELHHW